MMLPIVELENFTVSKKWVNVICITAIMVLAWIVYSIQAKAATYTQLGSNEFTLNFAIDSSIDYNIQSYDDAVDVVVPLYLNLVCNSNIDRFVYLNGLVQTYSILLQFNVTINGSVPNFNYYEPVRDDIILNRIDNYAYLFFNDFYYNYSSSGASNQILLGYIHYSHSIGGPVASVRCSNNTYSYTPAAGQTIYVSDYPMGAANAIIDAINDASDINNIISILQSIQGNTALLSQVVSGISSNGQLLNQILSALNNIDTSIDTISWNNYNTTYSVSNDGVNYSNSTITGKNIYFKFSTNGDIQNSKCIIKLTIPLYTSQGSSRPGIYVKEYYNESAYHVNNISNVKYCIVPSQYGIELYFIAPVSNYSEIIFYNINNLTLNFNSSRTVSLSYITSNDIEFWHIYNDLISSNLYDLLYLYIYGESTGADTGNEAAATLGSEAAAEHAVHESLYALSPGNINDLDSADGLAVLNDIANSTQFWGSLVTEFANVSTVIWGFFILALLLGLIAFILRL